MKPPPMQVVIKGWWVHRERRVSAEVLARFDKLRGKIRRRPWWRGLGRSWKPAP